MRNKNWVEFNNEPFRNENNHQKSSSEKSTRIIVYKQKKGKKGKTVTVISGLKLENKLEEKELLRKLKIFFSTGGKFNDQDFHLQGDLVEETKKFLRNENYQI